MALPTLNEYHWKMSLETFDDDILSTKTNLGDDDFGVLVCKVSLSMMDLHFSKVKIFFVDFNYFSLTFQLLLLWISLGIINCFSEASKSKRRNKNN